MVISLSSVIKFRVFFCFRDLLETGIKAEEKLLRKVQAVLARLRSHRQYQDELFQEARIKLHEFRVSTDMNT